MTIANDIISRRMPDFDRYIRQGETLDDMDEYGFTPLIECAITKQANIAEELIKLGVDVNKADATGRTPLHWAVDNEDIELCRSLLKHNAKSKCLYASRAFYFGLSDFKRANRIKTFTLSSWGKIRFCA